eukprot:4032945-Pyramimonas_sp.AAC.1
MAGRQSTPGLAPSPTRARTRSYVGHANEVSWVPNLEGSFARYKALLLCTCIVRAREKQHAGFVTTKPRGVAYLCVIHGSHDGPHWTLGSPPTPLVSDRASGKVAAAKVSLASLHSGTFSLLSHAAGGRDL